MIEQYMIRVKRPWPGVKKGDEIKVTARRKVQLVRGGFAVLVEETKAEAPAKPAAKPKSRAKPKAKKTLTLKKDDK